MSGRGLPGPAGLHPAAAGPTAALSAALQEPANKHSHKKIITKEAD